MTIFLIHKILKENVYKSIKSNTNHHKNTRVTYTNTISVVPRNSGDVVSVNPMTAAIIRWTRHRFTGQLSMLNKNT